MLYYCMLNYVVKQYTNFEAQVTLHKYSTKFPHTTYECSFPTPSFTGLDLDYEARHLNTWGINESTTYYWTLYSPKFLSKRGSYAVEGICWCKRVVKPDHWGQRKGIPKLTEEPTLPWRDPRGLGEQGNAKGYGLKQQSARTHAFLDREGAARRGFCLRQW